jgi:hypothetical protein
VERDAPLESRALRDEVSGGGRGGGPEDERDSTAKSDASALLKASEGQVEDLASDVVDCGSERSVRRRSEKAEQKESSGKGKEGRRDEQ